MTQQTLPAPPWIAYPGLERTSMFWRLGTSCEVYLERWHAWFTSLPKDNQRSYAHLFPEPFVWEGFWSDYGVPDVPAAASSRVQKYTRDRLDAPMLFFWGHHPAKDGRIGKSCLSQWWRSDFFLGGAHFTSMEQCMMACKAKLFHDEEMVKQIRAEDDPRKIKKLGRQVQNFDGAVWDREKFSIVLEGNVHKFAANPALRQFLLSTGDQVLVEASPYDTIWGIGLAEDDPRAHDPRQWRGENLLGFALMQARDELRAVYANEALCVTDGL